MQNLQIDPQRLWDTLMETAKFGATAKGGICRLTLTDDDRQVRDWFKAQCEALGLHGDGRRGRQHVRAAAGQATTTLPPIAMGSHLDTQPTGGKFDGVLGVLGALEAMRTLVMTGYETNAPIEVVNWTNEEGSRFAPAMLASGVFAGVFTPDYAYAREDREGKTVRRRAGADRLPRRGARPARHKLGALFELHIEQGPILEAEAQDDRRGPGRAGHALVRGHRHRPGRAYRRHADAPAQERAAGCRADDRAHRRRSRWSMRRRPSARWGWSRSGPTRATSSRARSSSRVDFRHPDEAVLDAMEARVPRRTARDHGAAEAGVRREADLGFAGGGVRPRADRLRPHGRRAGRLSDRATWSPAPATTPPTSPASRRRR